MNKIRDIIHNHRVWLTESEYMVQDELIYLDEDLAEHSLIGFNNVADSLGILASYYGIRGEVAIYDEDDSGWRDVSRAVLYRYWALKINSKSFSNKRFLTNIQAVPNLTNQLSSAACLLAVFIASGARELSNNVASVLSDMFTVEGAVDAAFLQQRKFEPFMLWLNQVYSANAQLPDVEALGVYQGVIEHWNDETALSSTITDLDNYHLTNCFDKGGAWNPEFKKPPFDLIPFERGAIAEVRRRAGLALPEAPSRLLPIDESSLSKLDFSNDEIVSKVEEAYEAFFS
jgi:hypothetical protein